MRSSDGPGKLESAWPWARGQKDLSRLFLRMGLGVVLVGLALGMGASMVAARYLSYLLYELSPTDPVTLVVVALTTLAAGASASYLPARRASRIDPSITMRYE